MELIELLFEITDDVIYEVSDIDEDLYRDMEEQEFVLQESLDVIN